MGGHVTASYLTRRGYPGVDEGEGGEEIEMEMEKQDEAVWRNRKSSQSKADERTERIE